MELVREFYQNISFGEGGVTSFAKGKKIDFDDEIFEKILKLSTKRDLLDSIEDRSVRIECILEIEDHRQFHKIYR